MNLQVGVKILLKNDQDKYLIVCRSLEKYPSVKDKWDIVGGRIDPGFSLIENLKREVKEETGLGIIDEPQLIFAQDILKEDNHVVRLTYTGAANGDVVLSDEHTDFKWLTIDEIKNMELVDRYLKEVLINKIICK